MNVNVSPNAFQIELLLNDNSFIGQTNIIYDESWKVFFLPENFVIQFNKKRD